MQNIPQYYTVEHSENMEGRLSNKMAALNGPNFGSLLFFRLDLYSLRNQTDLHEQNKRASVNSLNPGVTIDCAV